MQEQTELMYLLEIFFLTDFAEMGIKLETSRSLWFIF